MDLFTQAGLGIRCFTANGLKKQGHSTGGHDHEEPHVAVVIGKHRLIFRMPVLNEDKTPVLDKANGKPLKIVTLDKILAGNGVYSETIVEIPRGVEHELILLDPVGNHFCFFVPMDVVGLTPEEAVAHAGKHPEKWVIADHWTGHTHGMVSGGG